MVNIFGNLSARINTEIKKTIYNNQSYKRNRWGFVEGGIIKWSTRYKKYIILILVLAGLIIWNGQLWLPQVIQYFKEYYPGFLPSSNKSMFVSWQTTFLGGQLTIVGVVYPLVVGLVGVLFQNKSAKKILFPIYQKYSGFMFAGLSGLALSCFIIIGFVLRPFVGEMFYIVYCLTSAFWLSANILMTAWFFVVTFNILDEKSRANLISRFSINEAAELDVRRRLMRLLADNCVEEKLVRIPKFSPLIARDRDFTGLKYSKLSKNIKYDHRVKDIRFGLINFALLLQSFILWVFGIEKPSIVLYSPMDNNKNSLHLVGWHGFKLNALVRHMILHSYVTGVEDKFDYDEIFSIFGGLIGPADDALRDDDIREFSESLNNIVEWHTNISNSLVFKANDGRVDSWMLLENGRFWGGGDFLSQLYREYYRISFDAVEKIPENTSYYRECLLFYKKLYLDRDSIPVKEKLKIIFYSALLWRSLVEWRSYNSSSSDLRVSNKYEDILIDFVGSWENWLMYIEPDSGDEIYCSDSLAVILHHLELTASTVVSALRYDNIEAVGWGVDMLVNWHGKLRSFKHVDEEYRWNSHLITHSHLINEADSDTWKYILRENEYNKEAAFKLALTNAYLDLRILTACYVLLKPTKKDTKSLCLYVKSLLKGDLIHTEGSLGSSRKGVHSAPDLLGAFIRQRDYGALGYSDWTSKVVRSFGNISDNERRVSGRIYMGWGRGGGEDVVQSFVEIALLLSSSGWGLPVVWKKYLDSNSFSYAQRGLFIKDMKEWIRLANDIDSSSLLDNEIEFEENKACLIDSLERVVVEMSASQSDKLTISVVDKNRLLELGRGASTFITDDAADSFPLNLFERIILNDELSEKDEWVLRIGKYEKANIATNIVTTPVVNESQWLAEGVRRNVYLGVLGDFISSRVSNTFRFNDVEEMIEFVRSNSEDYACPLLFVGCSKHALSLRKKTYDFVESEKHGIQVLDGYGENYICHINRCEIYEISIPEKYSLLTSKEKFHKIGFEEIKDGVFVDVDFEPIPAGGEVGDLVLKYRMSVVLDQAVDCFRIELENGANEDTHHPLYAG